MTVATAPMPPTGWSRGAIDMNRSKETLQEGYLHAVVGAAGCTLAKPTPDNGVDWLVTHESPQHAVDTEALVKIQLKATHQIQPSPQGQYFSFSLERAHFDRLAQTPVTVTRILVVMITSANRSTWINSTPQHLEIQHQCFWINMEGLTSNGKDSQVVHIPTKNTFDDQALCHILCEIGQGRIPR